MNDTLDIALEEKTAPNLAGAVSAVHEVLYVLSKSVQVDELAYVNTESFKDAATELADLRAEAEAGLAEVLAEMENPSEMPPEVKQAVLMSTSRSALSSALEAAMRVVKDINSNAHSEFTRTKAGLSPEERMQQLWHEIKAIDEEIKDEMQTLIAEGKFEQKDVDALNALNEQIDNMPDGPNKQALMEQRNRHLRTMLEPLAAQGDQRAITVLRSVDQQNQHLEMVRSTNERGQLAIAEQQRQETGVRMPEEGRLTMDGFDISGISPELLAMAAGGGSQENMNTVTVPTTQIQSTVTSPMRQV